MNASVSAIKNALYIAKLVVAIVNLSIQFLDDVADTIDSFTSAKG